MLLIPVAHLLELPQRVLRWKIALDAASSQRRTPRCQGSVCVTIETFLITICWRLLLGYIKVDLYEWTFFNIEFCYMISISFHIFLTFNLCIYCGKPAWLSVASQRSVDKIDCNIRCTFTTHRFGTLLLTIIPPCCGNFCESSNHISDDVSLGKKYLYVEKISFFMSFYPGRSGPPVFAERVRTEVSCSPAPAPWGRVHWSKFVRKRLTGHLESWLLSCLRAQHKAGGYQYVNACLRMFILW